MEEIKDAKVYRILTIYTKLVQGEVINKKDLSERFKVNEKTIQRDLEDIRAYFYDTREENGINDVVYMRSKRGYCIEKREDILNREDVLALIKVLLESRAFCIDELDHITNALINQIGAEQRKHVKNIIGNEQLNYVSLKHNKKLLNTIWELSELIRSNEIIQLAYTKADGLEVKRMAKPVAIIFSEYYFYLLVYFDDFKTPTVLRIDRITNYKKDGKKFRIPESERFQDGEFRKKVQFMYSGKIVQVKFEFLGISIEAVLDRLPTARIVEKKENKFVIEAEVYGKGIMMWLLSQGSNVKVLGPEKFLVEFKEEVRKLNKMYDNN